MTPIGFVLRSPSDPDRAYVRVEPAYEAGLQGLDRFSHVIVLYRHQDAFDPAQQLMGVFATRSPARPNPIGLCVCELIRIDNELLTLQGLDALQGTAVLDIKPYIAKSDAVPGAVKG